MSYKYDFVDKNPYLTYTDEPNMTYSDVFGVYSDDPESADDEGGGGADLGELYELFYLFDDIPGVGEKWSDENTTPPTVTLLGVDESPLFECAPDDNIAYIELPNIAEGATYATMWFGDDQPYNYDGIYTFTVKTDGRDDTVGAVVNLNVTATTETETVEGDTFTRYVFTVPSKPVAADIPLAEGESIYGVFNCVCMVAEGGGE